MRYMRVFVVAAVSLSVVWTTRRQDRTGAVKPVRDREFPRADHWSVGRRSHRVPLATVESEGRRSVRARVAMSRNAWPGLCSQSHLLAERIGWTRTAPGAGDGVDTDEVDRRGCQCASFGIGARWARSMTTAISHRKPTASLVATAVEYR